MLSFKVLIAALLVAFAFLVGIAWRTQLHVDGAIRIHGRVR